MRIALEADNPARCELLTCLGSPECAKCLKAQSIHNGAATLGETAVAKIRFVEIRNFRSIQSLDWSPYAGINCLIGPGDSGKSTVLDAIEACLSARRNVVFAETDFHDLAFDKPIRIRITLGDLPAHLKDLDSYGQHLRSFEDISEIIEDEPRKGAETVLTVELLVQSHLEPEWRLYSDRSASEEARNLPWKDRLSLAPTRLGSHSSSHLSWTRNSVLNRLSEDQVDVGLELLSAARQAREGFGERAGVQLANTLQAVDTTAKSLGVEIGESAKALLDAHAASFNEGAISLHSQKGVPLRRLGTGSGRLLLAGLHKAAAGSSNLLLVDEVELGLEPHRLTRLLHSLGSKDKEKQLQVFMTTHSPVAVRELSGTQLHILRRQGPQHITQFPGSSDEVQSTLRTDPEAFLARTVIVCEGASEIGMLRGLDLLFADQLSLHADGVAFVNAGGGSPDKCLYRAIAIRKLGYRVLAFIDNDKPLNPLTAKTFNDLGGSLITWPPGQALEDVLFSAFAPAITDALIQRAIDLVSLDAVEQNLRDIGAPATLVQMQAARNLSGDYPPEHRALLARASRLRNRGWFKSISAMEGVFLEIVGPHWNSGALAFTNVVNRLYQIACAPHV